MLLANISWLMLVAGFFGLAVAGGEQSERKLACRFSQRTVVVTVTNTHIEAVDFNTGPAVITTVTVNTPGTPSRDPDVQNSNLSNSSPLRTVSNCSQAAPSHSILSSSGRDVQSAHPLSRQISSFSIQPPLTSSVQSSAVNTVEINKSTETVQSLLPPSYGGESKDSSQGPANGTSSGTIIGITNVGPVATSPSVWPCACPTRSLESKSLSGSAISSTVSSVESPIGSAASTPQVGPSTTSWARANSFTSSDQPSSTDFGQILPSEPSSTAIPRATLTAPNAFEQTGVIPDLTARFLFPSVRQYPEPPRYPPRRRWVPSQNISSSDLGSLRPTGLATTQTSSAWTVLFSATASSNNSTVGSPSTTTWNQWWNATTSYQSFATPTSSIPSFISTTGHSSSLAFTIPSIITSSRALTSIPSNSLAPFTSAAPAWTSIVLSTGTQIDSWVSFPTTSSSASYASQSLSFLGTSFHRPFPTASFQPSGSFIGTAVGSAVPTGTGTPSENICPTSTNVGNMTFDFDDVPPGQLFNPYHSFWFSEGFIVEQQDESLYNPVSGEQLVEFIPSSLSDGQFNNAHDLAMISVGPHSSNPCFQFNLYGLSLGCASNTTNQDCHFELWGLRYNATTGREENSGVSEDVQTLPCTQTKCDLTAKEFSGYENLTSFIIQVTSDSKPRIWWADNLVIGWADNGCDAAACRENGDTLAWKRSRVGQKRELWRRTPESMERVHVPHSRTFSRGELH